jgi:multiple sugar transport system ATP-binding protein
MTIFENMAFALSLRKAPKAEIQQRVERAAQILGLTQLLERYPRQLSGGQRQRVAMGRAIVRDPQVFLFDEPLSNLDAKLRVAMRSEIKELQLRLKTTTVYVTHDQIEAMTMADKIVVMRDGLIEQIGAPLDLYDHPDNQFVAGFIGSPSMNFLEGRFADGAFHAGDSLALPAGTNWKAASAGEAIYGVRPEHFRIDEDGIAVHVVVVEPTGSETEVLVRHDGVEFNCLFRSRVPVKPGDTIRIRPDADQVHLFDRATGRRVG